LAGFQSLRLSDLLDSLGDSVGVGGTAEDGVDRDIGAADEFRESVTEGQLTRFRDAMVRHAGRDIYA
jgi:hypothetical protein